MSGWRQWADENGTMHFMVALERRDAERLDEDTLRRVWLAIGAVKETVDSIEFEKDEQFDVNRIRRS